MKGTNFISQTIAISDKRMLFLRLLLATLVLLDLLYIKLCLPQNNTAYDLFQQRFVISLMLMGAFAATFFWDVRNVLLSVIVTVVLLLNTTFDLYLLHLNRFHYSIISEFLFTILLSSMVLPRIRHVAAYLLFVLFAFLYIDWDLGNQPMEVVAHGILVTVYVSIIFFFAVLKLYFENKFKHRGDMVDIIFQDSQECMILVDGTSLLIEFLNQATKNIFSVNHSLVSTSVVDFFAKKNLAFSVEEIRKELQAKGYYIQHIEFQKEDGESFWGNMYIRKLEAENSTKWFIRIFDESAQFKASSLLRENWNTFARVLDAIPHKIFLKDPSSRFMLINSILEEVHSLPKEALIGKTDFDLFPSHLAETFYNHEQEIMKTGSMTMPVEETVQMPDGSTRIFKISKIPFYLPEYKANGLLGLGIDVTQVHNYQEKLRKSEANYRMLLEQASDGIYSADRLGIITDANPKACQMLGYSKSELVGMNVKSLIDEKDDRFFNIELLKNGLNRSLILERKLKQKEGAVFIVELSVTIFDDGGHQGIMRDITERKRVENIIQGNEKKFRALIESSYDITVILNDKLQMAFVSPSVQKILGYNPKEIEGKTLFEFIHPEDRESIELFMRQLLGIPDEFKILPEIRIVSLSGQYRYFEMAGSNLMADSAVNGLVINLHDISERKSTELKLLNTNYELDSFVYKVSHDIKAPLRSVMGLIGIAKMENKQEEINTYLDMMNKSVHNLDQFIKDLIQFSRNTRMELDNTHVDFNKILDDCIEDLRYMDKVDRIEIRKNVQPNLQFQSDNLRINTIIGNLLSNSLKYHKFEAGISYVNIAVSENQGAIEILVEDNGVGIGQEYQDKIFDMFYRASEMSSGSGLGLYIVKTALNKLKGSIEVHSTPNVGTKFRILLPKVTLTNSNGQKK
ncbi:MAG TPA: hypothetical protein DCR46_07380 [Cytophagales bacterium]|nr:hypothetical protein [Cytophagales bacterium]